MVNYAGAFNQSKTRKYFEWIIMDGITYGLPIMRRAYVAFTVLVTVMLLFLVVHHEICNGSRVFSWYTHSPLKVRVYIPKLI